MFTIKVFICHYAMLCVVNANALTLRASSLGYNTSALNSSGVFSGLRIPSISSKIPPIVHTSRNNSASSCCFLVQDTIDVRYWADYAARTTKIATQTTIITFATQYIDTTVTTNVSTVIRTLNYTSNSSAVAFPTLPNTNDIAPGPLITQIPFNTSDALLYGTTITPPTEVYVFSSVNVINVPAVVNKDGQLRCATTSTYRFECPVSVQKKLKYTNARMDNITHSTGFSTSFQITGVNSNAESYFFTSRNQRSAVITSEYDMVQISFSKPFLYAPLSDQFPSKIVNENIGYVPQTLIEWIAQQPDYVSKFPGIASCMPGGPSIEFHAVDVCPLVTATFEPRLGVLDILASTDDLIVSSTVTIPGRGCFHPGACPTPAAPGATAVTATPTVTPDAHSQDSSSPPRLGNLQLPQPLNQPLPAPAETQGSTPASSPKNQAPNGPENPVLNVAHPSQSDAAIISPSPPTDSSDPLANSPENDHPAESPPNNPAKPPSKLPGLAAVIASASGLGSNQPSKSEDVKPSPGASPISAYSISIAPSGSAVVINGGTSIPPAIEPGRRVPAANSPIAVGSEQITQNAASQYVVGTQTLTPGAPPINVQGTEVSLAPSASAIVIAGSTIGLSSAKAPAFTVGSEVVTANTLSQYVINGQTLLPGGPAVTVSGTRLSLAPSGTQVVVGSSTIGLAPTITSPPLPPLTFGSQAYTANSNSEYLIAGQTLSPGGPAIIVSGTPISLAPAATQVIIGSSTENLSPAITPPPLTFDSQIFTANSASDYIINGQTLRPGGPAITVSGTPISLAQGATQVVIGTSTENLAPITTPPPLTFGSQTYTADSASKYIIDGQTLLPGGPAITISGTRVSLAPRATQAVIGSSTENLTPLTTPPPLTFGSQIYTADSASDYIIAGQTLRPGGPAITVSGTRLSLAPDATQVVIGSSTENLAPNVTPPPFTFGSQTYTADSASDYIIDGQTLLPGGPAITVSGTRLSLAPGATQVVIGSSTIPLLPTPAPSLHLPVLTFDSGTYTANAAGDYIINGQTLIPGGAAITISGTRLSLAPGATQVVIGSSTIPLLPTPAPSLRLPILTIDSRTYTANAAGDYIIDGQTLLPGSPAITVSGTRISLAPSATQLVIGSSTIPLNPTSPLPLLTIGSQTITPNAAGLYVIAGQTLTPGGAGIVVPGSLLAASGDGSVVSTTAAAAASGVGNDTTLRSSPTNSTSGVLGGPAFTGTGTRTGRGDRMSIPFLHSVLAPVLSFLTTISFIATL